MLYNIYANQAMGQKENISGNAVIVFEVMKQLMSLNYIDVVMFNEKRHHVLYHNMILNQIPLFIKSKRTLGNAISELKNAGLIEYNENNMQPAYAFSNKAMGYITSFTKANVGEVDAQENKIQKKKPLFDLSKKTTIANLKPTYLELLKTHSMKMCENQKVPFEEYERFIDYHASNGSSFVNYLRAFSLWIRNYKKWNQKPNGGDGTIGGVNIND